MFEEERFNRSIAVFSVNLFFATALVDPRMMEWLKSNLRRNTIEVCGQWVTAWRLPPSAVGRHVEDLMKQIELIRGFVYQIPRVVPSLFPALPPQWDERWSH